MTRVALGNCRQSGSFPLGRLQPLLKCQERFILVFLLAGQNWVSLLLERIVRAENEDIDVSTDACA
jgi:hypothetical protein